MATKKPALRKRFSQPSYTIQSDEIALAISELGGCMAPVAFYRKSKNPVTPLAVAPWWNEKIPSDQPPVIKALRGDFFCMPFGGGETKYKGRAYPPHGETANRKWRFGDLSRTRDGKALHLKMDLRLQKGTVEKSLGLVSGENVIYVRHRISGLSGPMSYSHHATLQFPDRPGAGRLSFSRFKHAATFYIPVETPEIGTYSLLKPNTTIRDLTRVPLIDGTTTDLSSYPNRRGYEDLAMICADPKLEFAWSAVTFERERYVWFNLKDPKVLASTVLWFTNGGRHFAPWSGRHINVMGMEEGTTFWGDGIEASAKSNALTRKGIKTSHTFSPRKPYDVPCIMGVARIPKGFNEVKDIKRIDDRTIRLVGNKRHNVDVPAQLGFLETASLEGLIE
ncbi:MAG: hypothetical protein CME19_13360 [Gemmatimonadetes bacterium]|nr:hypothetical protein [Gemmatimonadota bacterium]